MAGRYVLSNYNTAEDEQPRIASRANDLRKAEASFTASAEGKIRSVVLYDTEKDEVLKIGIEGEPIYLVRAIELARKEKNPNAAVSATKMVAIKAAAGYAIGEIVKALTGASVPGVGGVIMAHFLGPYYAIKGDGAAAAATGAGLWGCVSGAVIGTLIFPGVGTIIGGAVLGGAIGGATAGIAAGALVKAFTPPSPKCTNCGGSGLVDDFRTCPNCSGYGYKK
ncbi:uncharacterized protein LOC119730930 [Patiria miniata]|uniref:Uncharacterized protein n=1 Tax=Patiria miniata TaxID=46514 RepID=A0A914A928_PATMI|nr:uncharacterized protein LOC119730930 [Patiria miniata]